MNNLHKISSDYPVGFKLAAVYLAYGDHHYDNLDLWIRIGWSPTYPNGICWDYTNSSHFMGWGKDLLGNSRPNYEKEGAKHIYPLAKFEAIRDKIINLDNVFGIQVLKDFALKWKDTF